MPDNVIEYVTEELLKEVAKEVQVRLELDIMCRCGVDLTVLSIKFRACTECAIPITILVGDYIA